VLRVSDMKHHSKFSLRELLRPIGRRVGQRATALAGGFMVGFTMLGLIGCGQVDLNSLAMLRSEPAEAAATEGSAGESVGSPLELVGESAESVQRLLGKPRGKLHTGDGEVWLYEQWRVEMNDQQEVIAVERDRAASVAAVGPAGRGTAATGGTGAGHQRALTVVANGGQEVNLASMLVPGKVTVVDFYADWCGPCRQVSPHLERLAREDPDVNVVKVDIVKWNTPVTQQYNIRSVPNMRVYGRTGRVVGSPTSDFRQILRDVEQAKR
jgi:thiol-disulfide isomerase/thioredoxin